MTPSRSRRRIYLMRHGHVDYLARETVASGDIDSVALTPRGMSEAEAAGRALAHVDLDRALCSGLRRTRETAEMVLSQRKSAPPLEIAPAFIEIRGGKMQAVRSRDELIEAMKKSFAGAALPGAPNRPDAETFLAAQTRAVDAITGLLAQPGWSQLLLVAHEGINRLVLSWAVGAGLHAMGAFEQDTGCINVLDFDLEDARIERPIVKAVNLTPYNYLKHGMNLTSLEAIFERDLAHVRV
jgi:phosphoserine phosphatase